eukprot:m.108235 g.108235  ORF g.108235 m.108235 type:complete len:132 (+) comp12703_c4_seq1:45-440(+)
MSCPVLNSMPEELSETLAEFATLLPSCKEEDRAVHDCRTTVAQASSFNKFLWNFGIGTSHCVEEVQRFTNCNKQREKVSDAIMSHCVEGDHRHLARQYKTCLKENNNDPTSCKHILSDFLECARSFSLTQG